MNKQKAQMHEHITEYSLAHFMIQLRNPLVCPVFAKSWQNMT